MSTGKKDKKRQLETAMQEVLSSFGDRPYFSGVDIGYRWTDGAPSKEIVVRVHITRKLPEADIPESEVFPKSIGGVPLDVIEGDYRTTDVSATTHDHRQRFAKLMGGLSTGRTDGGAGTIGLIAIDKQTGRPGLLSNWHVIAGAQALVGDTILHPATNDGGAAPRDRIGVLKRWMLDNDGDAAFAHLTGDADWLPLQFGSLAQVATIRSPELGEVLVKAGRTTGVTEGRVDGDGVYRIFYETAPGRIEPRDIAGFKIVPVTEGNPENEEVSLPGDSGSLWVDPDGQSGVGLHFAGDTSDAAAAEHAIACHLPRVMDRLELRPATFSDLMYLSQERAEVVTASSPQPIVGSDVPSRAMIDLQVALVPSELSPSRTNIQSDPDDLPSWVDPGLHARVRITSSAEQVPSRNDLTPIFNALISELKSAGFNTNGVTWTTSVSSLLSSGNPRATLVWLVNRTKWFRESGLRDLKLADLNQSSTIYDVCVVISQMTRRTY